VTEKGARWARRWGLRVAANLTGLVPAVWLVRTYASGGFFIDPVKEITIRTGRLAITFLLLSLACTPVVTLTGISRLTQARRPLGLWSLAYAGAHALAFAGWDYRFDLGLLLQDLAYQRFVLVGAGAFLFLVVLGVTSIPGLRKRMGRSWRRVQRTAYLAGGLAVWHVLWVKKDPREAWLYPALLALLLVVRVPIVRGALVGLRKRLGGLRRTREAE
jgi:methionine sulfoxide reductase heme-binding subunit